MLKKFENFLNKQSDSFIGLFMSMLTVSIIMIFASFALFFTEVFFVFVITFPLLFILGTFIVAQFKETNE